ncbi:MAG: HAD family phosphatase [Candidatus Liptonbacteria bacterium]|nr:HAD family phosphatase [Candidatus Liptonbacteria bacterium]
MIKTIIFDIGGVIARTNFKALYSNFAERVGLPSEFVVDYHTTNVEDLLLGKITLDQFWKDMRGAGAKPDLDLQAIWIEEGTKNREINSELLKIIEKLRKNYSAGVLTNLTPPRLVLDEKMNLYSHFDYAILSCKEHLKKPDPAFYQLSLAAASVKPEEAIFVDDKEKCTVGAERVGMKSILYVYPDNAKLLKNLKRFGVSIE